MNEKINLDDSVLAPKRPLSFDAADTEGHVQNPIDGDSDAEIKLDTEGHKGGSPTPDKAFDTPDKAFDTGDDIKL